MLTKFKIINNVECQYVEISKFKQQYTNLYKEILKTRHLLTDIYLYAWFQALDKIWA